MKKKTKPTVRDVARKAGVSPSTVSRVISNNPRISEATRERVLKEMEALQYQPNAIARSLARSKTRIIGVLMPAKETDMLLNPFFPEALHGIVTSAARHGHDVLLSTGSKYRNELEVIRNLVGGGKVDGLIILRSRENDPNLQYLLKADFPCSVIGSGSGLPVNHVNNDNVRAALELTRHILETGRRNVFFASGPIELSVTKERLEGYRLAIEEAGLPFREDHIFTGDFDEETGMRLAYKMVRGKDKPDAVVATDDVIAFGFSRTITTLGYRIPKDIAIGSFNNSVLSRYSDSQLTSVDIRAAELGKKSVEQLIAAIEEGLRGASTIIEHQLIKRKSTLG